MSTHRFDYVASTALHSEASCQQRSYFSVLEQVAQASRLQQQLGCFCRTRTIRLSTPPRQRISTSSHRRLENSFSHSFLRLLLTVTDPFLNFISTLLTLLTLIWTVQLPYLPMCNLCNRFRSQARGFRVWTRQHITRHFPRPASQENAHSATPPESVELRPVPRSARVSVVEPQVAETQPLNES